MSNTEAVRRHRKKMKSEKRCQRCGSRDYRTYDGYALCLSCAVKAQRTCTRLYWQAAHVHYPEPPGAAAEHRAGA
jgi:ribosomal protein L37E